MPNMRSSHPLSGPPVNHLLGGKKGESLVCPVTFDNWTEEARKRVTSNNTNSLADATIETRSAAS